jgi:hypothetical protein
MNIGIIYRAFNKTTGKSYIGQTIRNLNERIKNHYRDSEKYTYAFANALRKHSEVDWEWKVLYDNVPIYQLNNMEKWCIANYNTYLVGYNSTIGGDASPASNPEVAKKIAKANSGKKQSKETIRKRVQKLLGRKHPHSKETKKKMIEASKNMSAEKRRKIVNAHFRGSFSEEHKRNLSRALKGRESPNKGNKLSDEARRSISNALRGTEYGAKNLYKITKPDSAIEVIRNLRKYCRDNKLTNSCMYKVAKGQLRGYKGYLCEVIVSEENKLLNSNEQNVCYAKTQLEVPERNEKKKELLGR